MNSFARVLLAVDLTDFDQHLYRYVSQLNKLFKIDQIDVVHVMPEKLSFIKDSAHILEEIKPQNEINDKIKNHITELAIGNNLSIAADNIRIVENERPYQGLKNFIADNTYDLLILGKKDLSAHSGLTSRRIMNRFAGNILFVTEKLSADISHVLVPFDYDDLSAKALKLSQSLSINSSVLGLHIIRILDHDHYFGIAYNPAYAESRTSEDREYLHRFLEKNEIAKEAMQFSVELESYHRIAFKIKETQTKHQSDLIIVGAGSHNAMERILVGSTTEKLLTILDRGALLIIR